MHCTASQGWTSLRKRDFATFVPVADQSRAVLLNASVRALVQPTANLVVHCGSLYRCWCSTDGVVTATIDWPRAMVKCTAVMESRTAQFFTRPKEITVDEETRRSACGCLRVCVCVCVGAVFC
jgi:hypothetical protein